ncbi:glycosyltransferase family 1 protein [Pseudomonas sp. R16(2017)]|uniref:glycosyltransferase family 4 protein n=1 Tax=Pseudomonas sp. R16(2017) TaxID=1981704 RepID=UPI000A1D8636|nr:glycosyltransferase family 1 protein [Pseudomonas sp. R16(2017)]
MTTWFDVTTILGWRRPAVGIIRTEAEAAAHALELIAAGEDVKFCAYDHAAGYAAVSAGDVAATLKRISGAHAVAPGKVASGAANKSSIEARLKDKAIKVLNRLPTRLSGRIYQFFQQRRVSIVEAVIGVRHLRSAAKAFLKPANRGYVFAPVARKAGIAGHPFSKGDSYISVGLDWDNKDLPYLYELKKKVGLRVVLCCYDVIPVRLPHLCVGDVAAKFANYFTDVAWCADKILCISECTRKDLISLLSELGAPVPETAVVKLGCQLSHELSDDISADVKALLKERFVLFVSTIERRKNHEVLYRAYTRLVDKGVQDLPKLVFVGMPGWGVGDLLMDINLDPRTKDHIRILNNVSDSDLMHLYHHCMMTAFPSLYEGWGLPVAESLAAGKYCLASSAASIPEVGGDLLDYLEPWDVTVWAAELEKYAFDPAALAAKEEAIRQRYLPVAWKETAQVVFDSSR